MGEIPLRQDFLRGSTVVGHRSVKVQGLSHRGQTVPALTPLRVPPTCAALPAPGEFFL